MANYKKTGDLYVGKHGSDANPGTNPDLPKLTIAGAIAVAVAGNDIIIGDGLYEESNLDLRTTACNLIGDGVVFLEGDGSNIGVLAGVGAIAILEDLIFINYLEAVQGGSQDLRDVEFENVIIINSSITNFGSQSSLPAYKNNQLRLLNSSVTFGLGQTGERTGIENSIFENGVFDNIYNDYVFSIRNCVFKDYTINLSDADVSSKFSFCNFFNCTFNYNGSVYVSLSSIKAVVGGFTNCSEADPQLNRITGETQTLDFSVAGSSPLLITGFNGTNIGAVKRGLPQTRTSDSIQNGTNTNIVFDSNKWQVQSGQTTGSIESDVVDFGLTVKSPKLNIKGLVNFLDNVPDFDNSLLDPNKLDIQARYAIIGEDISLATYKPFLLNERMLLDAGGLSNGEASFDWGNTVTIPMKEIQFKITLRQNYAES